MLVEGLRASEKALQYAKQAAALSLAPHILDTLAESYYVNGFYDEAITAITQALAMAPRDRHYYESQLRKYQEGKLGSSEIGGLRN